MDGAERKRARSVSAIARNLKECAPPQLLAHARGRSQHEPARSASAIARSLKKRTKPNPWMAYCGRVGYSLREVPMKKTFVAFAVLAVVVIAGIGSGIAQAPGDKVVKLDPALDALISVDAKIEKVASGFGFTEGPVWVQRGREGYLLFTDIPGNKVHKMTSDGKVSLYEDQSGYRGPWNGWTMLTVGSSTPNGPFIMLGADGLAVDPEGRLLLCAFGDRALERVEKDGKRTILADKYEGKRLNGPNDVVVKRDGTIYFSDTFGGLRNRADDPNKGLERNGFFMLRNGKLSMVVSDMKTVN